ncbi:MAG: type II-A CRISPR-associated protein Csn2 [Clostridia bacterium]|nr:type II-A CRISPR-associated protein Csn2 [Clostridia bacterium]
MKLINSKIDYIFDFSKNDTYSLVIENPNEFYSLTMELFYQCSSDLDGEWVFGVNNEIKSISKNLLLLHNYYEFSCSSKKIDSLINSTILDALKTNDYFEEISSINSELFKINDKICEKVDLPIESSFEIDFDSIVKLLNYKIKDDLDFLNKLITYIDIFIKIKKIKVVVFIGLFSYLSEQEIDNLIKQLRYMDIKIMFIDNYDKCPFKYVKKIIIDNDLCII